MWHTFGRPVLLAAIVTGLLFAGIGAGRANAADKSDSVVKTTTTADKPGPDGKQVISIKLTIEKGWHTYANPSGSDSTYPTTVKVEGKKADEVKVDYPQGKLVKDKDVGDYFTYEGDATIKVTVPRTKDDSPLKLKLKFQACNEMNCLPPATVELTVP
jgi:DsbC/DsbD-like thiol-disulfide interchange protein